MYKTEIQYALYFVVPSFRTWRGVGLGWWGCILTFHFPRVTFFLFTSLCFLCGCGATTCYCALHGSSKLVSSRSPSSFIFHLPSAGFTHYPTHYIAYERNFVLALIQTLSELRGDETRASIRTRSSSLELASEYILEMGYEIE